MSPKRTEHDFLKSGDITVVLYVTDTTSALTTATTTVHITLSPMQLLDNGNFAPGSEFYEGDTVSFNYIIQGGEPSYSIDWYLMDMAKAKAGRCSAYRPRI